MKITITDNYEYNIMHDLTKLFTLMLRLFTDIEISKYFELDVLKFQLYSRNALIRIFYLLHFKIYDIFCKI